MVTLRQARGVGRDDVVLSTPACESHSVHRGSTLDLSISEDGADIVPDKAYSQEQWSSFLAPRIHHCARSYRFPSADVF